MTTNLFAIANVKQLRTGCSFRNLLPFFRTSWGVGVLNSIIFNSFHNRVEFGTILEGLRNFAGGGLNPQTPPPPRYATAKSGERLTPIKYKCFTMYSFYSTTSSRVVVFLHCSFPARQPPVDHGLLIQEVSIPHTTTHHNR